MQYKVYSRFIWLFISFSNTMETTQTNIFIIIVIVLHTLAWSLFQFDSINRNLILGSTVDT